MGKSLPVKVGVTALASSEKPIGQVIPFVKPTYVGAASLEDILGFNPKLAPKTRPGKALLALSPPEVAKLPWYEKRARSAFLMKVPHKTLMKLSSELQEERRRLVAQETVVRRDATYLENCDLAAATS